MKIDTSNLKKGLSKRLTIGREATKEYQSYFIPIDQLFFNDQNGRIATYIKKMAGKLEDVWKLETLTNTMILLQDTSRLLLMTMVIPLRKPKRTLRAKGRGFRVSF